jgi:prepilin-type N-terminal cleavage/methylation domain-containing protein
MLRDPRNELRAPQRPSARRGFTLLEILAAVAVLSLLYIVLAGSGIQGIRAEAAAARRIEAAEIADRVLAELELELVQNPKALELGHTEEEEPPYIIETDIAEFGIELPLPPSTLSEEGSEGDEVLNALESLEKANGNENPLRLIQIRVRWGDGLQERSILRTTFVLDHVELSEEAESQGTDTGDLGDGINPPISPEEER